MTMTLYEFIMRQVRTMTLDDCIKYMENVSLERKPRSRKARHILRYLRELKKRIERDKCSKDWVEEPMKSTSGVMIRCTRLGDGRKSWNEDS